MCNNSCDYKCRQTRMPVQSRNILSKYTKINQIKKKFKKLDKSQTRKDDLGKNERLDGLKTQKGGPGKVRDMNKIIILIDQKPARAIYAKVKDQKTK